MLPIPHPMSFTSPEVPALTDDRLERPDALRRAYAAVPDFTDDTLDRYELYVVAQVNGWESVWVDSRSRQRLIADRHFILK